MYFRSILITLNIRRDKKMPGLIPEIKSPRSLRGESPLLNLSSSQFDPSLAGQSIVDGLEYLKKRLDWSGTKIANIIHLPPNTVNTWLKKGIVPISSSILQPDIQAIVHLLAI